MDSANGRLIESIREKYNGSFSVAIFNDAAPRRKYSLEVKANHVYALPFPLSYWGGLKNSFRIYRLLKQVERENDILLIQLPFVAFIPIFFLSKPILFHVCANVLTGASNPVKYNSLKRVISKSFAGIMHKSFNYFFGRSKNRLIVNGDELGKIYSLFNPKVAVSSSIYRNEIIDPGTIKRRELSNEFRILFIGRPVIDKGYRELMKAFISLVDDEYDVSLEMLGTSKDGLHRLVNDNIPQRYLERVNCHGFLPWGDEFKKIVSECHCLVMSSLSGEGTPRVLIEARALGCPVIATDVGGVTSSVEHDADGIVVPIGQWEPIAAGIKKLMLDEDYRNRLRLNGIERVRQYTLENFSELFAEELNKMTTT